MIPPEQQLPRMADGRPILPQDTSPLELVFIILALAGVVVGVVPLVTSWARLPELIPTHFGIDGKPNAYGDKGILLLLPIISLLLVALVLWAGGKPHLFNYPWKITDENAARQYRAARVMMRLLAFLVAWLLAYLTYETTQTALGTSSGLSAWFLIVSFVGVFGTLLGYILVAVRLR